MKISLAKDELIVLFELLSRFSDSDVFGIEDQSEMHVLWDLQAQLEELIPETFSKNYELLLSEARNRIRDKGDFTNADKEKAKGRPSLWLEPQQIEFLANEWRKIPEDAPDEVKQQWSSIAFRAMAALHKAGIEYEPKFPVDDETYKY